MAYEVVKSWHLRPCLEQRDDDLSSRLGIKIIRVQMDGVNGDEAENEEQDQVPVLWLI